MKNFNLNEKLCKNMGKKLISIALVTTLTYTQIAKCNEVYAYTNPKTTNELFMNQTSFKYSVNNKNYTITRKVDGTLTVMEDSVEGVSTLVMDNEGNVTVTIKDGIMPKIERYKIDNFDGQNLNINSVKLKNNDFKKSVDKLETYFEKLDFDDNVKDHVSRIDYNNVQTTFIKDLEKNKIKIEDPKEIKHKKSLFDGEIAYASTPCVEAAQELQSVGIALGSSSIVLDGLVVAGGTVAATGILLTTGLIIGAVVLGCVIYNSQVYWIETPNNLVNHYEDARFIPMTLKDAQAMGYVDIRSVITELEDSLSDNNPDNDFFKSYMVKEKIVVIDFKNPISKSEASVVLHDILNSRQNIYTYSPYNAKELIKYSGGIPGTSNGLLEYQGRGECHAYYNSYKAYDPLTDEINTKLLVENDKMGIYYWHFHFNGKKMLNGQMNNKHIFFGKPKVKCKLGGNENEYTKVKKPMYKKF